MTHNLELFPSKTVTNSGTCMLCGYTGNKGAMTRHLKSCSASPGDTGSISKMLHLRVQANHQPTYWLDLEVAADATLQKLDRFLRHLWLECCGHLSAFRVGHDEFRMIIPLSRVFSAAGEKILYEYDFGSTTSLTVHRVASRQSPAEAKKVRLLARNDPPEFPCLTCGEVATLVCTYCQWEDDAYFCRAHAREHDCEGEEAFLPVVNSPRMGVCGYTG